MPTGTVEIDFGAHPGSWDASVPVTNQTDITANSKVEAWIRPSDTADHNVDEHLVEPPRVVAGNIVAATGFTIYGFSDKSEPLYGRFNVAWVWA